ncbi:MAG: hypothetical protein DRN71_06060 [Candidatus Nanohalarchaeota archaeon]|nr:MAG: hypothetical protein DRN71_06060 [Candidatus Nanohaloarchaeota archaeon]
MASTKQQFKIEPYEEVLRGFESNGVFRNNPAMFTDRNIYYLDGILQRKQHKIPYKDINAAVLFKKCYGYYDRYSDDKMEKITLRLSDKSGEQFDFSWEASSSGYNNCFDTDDIKYINNIKSTVIDAVVRTKRDSIAEELPIDKSEPCIEDIIPSLKEVVEEVVEQKGYIDDGEFCRSFLIL